MADSPMFFVVGKTETEGLYWPLTDTLATLSDCERAINWQFRGSPADPVDTWSIAYVDESGMPRIQGTDRPTILYRGPFTDSAFAEKLQALGIRKGQNITRHDGSIVRTVAPGDGHLSYGLDYDGPAREYDISDAEAWLACPVGWTVYQDGPYHRARPDSEALAPYRMGRSDYSVIRDLASNPLQRAASVSDDEYDDMLGCVPPIYVAGVSGFLVGEPLTFDARGTVYANYFRNIHGDALARYHCLSVA